jgi:hypothetical protein
MQKVFLLLLLGAVLGASSCGAARKASRDVTLSEKSSAGLLKALAARKWDAEWFDAKAKLDVDDGRQSVKANAVIRMKKGEFVWVSIKKFGFEAARALIRKDSVFVINRLNNEYYAEPISFLTKEYNIPADLSTLQNLILGNPVFLSTAGFHFEDKVTHYELSGKGGGMDSRYLVNSADLTLQHIGFEDKQERRTIKCGFGEYAPLVENKNFSYLRSIEMDSPATGRMAVGLQFSEVVLNVPKDVKFEIPDKYTRVSAK